MPAVIGATPEEVIRLFAGGLRAAGLYGASHPLVLRQMAGFAAALASLHVHDSSVVIGLVAGELVVGDRPPSGLGAQCAALSERLTRAGVERIEIARGVEVHELETFVRALAAAIAGTAGAGALSSAHIRVSRLAGDGGAPGRTGRDGVALQRHYGDAVTRAAEVWESARTEGRPDIRAAALTIENLAEAVTVNRTAMIALTAMKHYHDYTFTHMVNVSILAMAQARALGIDGRLLREFGFAGLMHDIGKVRTPVDILNKPSALDDREFTIIKRHPVDGASMLRQMPDVPVLAPVVAFEHHLRLDGQGYPHGVARATLNLATRVCTLADVYDAMRSQRAYKEAFSTDRILAVLKQNDSAQFDQHLLRRFVQLMGIYPPGALLTLSDGRVAVVTGVHAPKPDRPALRVLFEADARPSPGTRIDLWRDDAAHLGVKAVMDPAAVGLDPERMLEYAGPGG